MKKFIWLFGENLGDTANNNSYYFWDQVCNIEDEIEKYYVLTKSSKNKKFYNSLSNEQKDKIIWKNSLKHIELFKKADMYFVSLSYKDILPEQLIGRKVKFIIKRPLIYLQHGTTAIKKLGYKGNTYYNNMFRFVYYNPDIKDRFCENNDFHDYQMYYGEFHPRYKQFVKYYLEKQKESNSQKKILFFITWREYFGDNFATRKFINKLNQVFENPNFINYVKDKNIDVKLCMHQFYDDEKVAVIKESIKDTNIELVHPSNIDLMKELATCDLLITDYSSVGFDSALLGTPVMLFQPDCEEYFLHRESYYDISEIEKYSIKKPSELVENIIDENYGKNEFFISKMPKKIDLQEISEGKHIDKMYEYFKKLQLNRITILGYNFTGRGGTVSATKALAESLLERGYLVELYSLKMTEKHYSVPYGMASIGFYSTRENKYIRFLKRNLVRSRKNYYYLDYDINKNILYPYIGKALKKYLETTNSRTIISTRESLHLFVKNFASESVVNKLYFFHTDSTILNDYYPGLIDALKATKLENCIFVTDASKEAYKKQLGYDNYEKGYVVSNSLESKAMITKDLITIDDTKEGISAVSLLRLSADRKKDVDNIIEFGKYLLDHKAENVVVKVYGQGDLVNYLLDEIFKNNIDDYIYYMGVTNTPNSVIIENDCVIDFCNNQSFGMTYIESIFNGRPVFARENVGSLEVLKDIPSSYYHSNEELYKKICSVKNKTLSEYKKNWDLIDKRYSRKIIADKIEKMLK